MWYEGCSHGRRTGHLAVVASGADVGTDAHMVVILVNVAKME